MTNQEAFTKSAEHLLQQGVRSLGISGKCLYYGPGKVKCAVGALIPQEAYRSEFENMSLQEIANRVEELQGAAIYLLRDLQCIHDTVEPENWRRELNIIARQYKLQGVPAGETNENLLS